LNLYTRLGITDNYSASANLRWCPQFITVSTIRFLATDFNTGSITVSLNYIPQISRYYTTRKSSQAFSSQLTCCHLFSFIFYCCFKRLSVLLITINTLPESELLCDWLFTANQFVFAPSTLRLTTRDFFSTEPFQL
jgi:hypothetical protein